MNFTNISRCSFPKYPQKGHILDFIFTSFCSSSSPYHMLFYWALNLIIQPTVNTCCVMLYTHTSFVNWCSECKIIQCWAVYALYPMRCWVNRNYPHSNRRIINVNIKVNVSARSGTGLLHEKRETSRAKHCMHATLKVRTDNTSVFSSIHVLSFCYPRPVLVSGYCHRPCLCICQCVCVSVCVSITCLSAR